MTTKLTPDEVLRTLDELAAEEEADEIARIDALTGDELDRALEAEGLDPAAERARALELIRGRTASPSADALPAPAPVAVAVPRNRLIEVTAGAGIAASFVAGVLSASGALVGPTLVASGHEGGAGPSSAGSDWNSSVTKAAKLRVLAENLWYDGKLEEALAALDGARALDPKGEKDARVHAFRARLEAKIRARE